MKKGSYNTSHSGIGRMHKREARCIPYEPVIPLHKKIAVETSKVVIRNKL